MVKFLDEKGEVLWKEEEHEGHDTLRIGSTFTRNAVWYVVKDVNHALGRVTVTRWKD